jgi:hypothetical protein
MLTSRRNSVLGPAVEPYEKLFIIKFVPFAKPIINEFILDLVAAERKRLII